MISNKNKNKLYAITFFLDCILMYILEHEDLNDTDTNFIYSMFLVHLLLYVSLYNSYYKLVDALHVILFASFFYGVYLENFLLKSLLLWLIGLIQILWVVEKDCIMNTKPLGPGYGQILSILIIIYFAYFSFELGKQKAQE